MHKVGNQEGEILYTSEVSAMILQYLRYAEEYVGKNEQSSYYGIHANDAQRQAAKMLVVSAGLEVERIVNEPTAAALAYGLDKVDTWRKNLSIRLSGGGTFDVSILELGNAYSTYQQLVICISVGMTDKNRDFLVEEFQRKYGDLSNDKMR